MRIAASIDLYQCRYEAARSSWLSAKDMGLAPVPPWFTVAHGIGRRGPWPNPTPPATREKPPMSDKPADA
jgi:hypothetical protein